MSIDIKQVRVGDKVRVRYYEPLMEEPMELPLSTVYKDEDGDLCVGPLVLSLFKDDDDEWEITILEIRPNVPPEAHSLVVQDGAGIYYGNVDGRFVGLGGGMSGETVDFRDLQTPITVVVEHDGTLAKPKGWKEKVEDQRMPMQSGWYSINTNQENFRRLVWTSPWRPTER